MVEVEARTAAIVAPQESEIEIAVPNDDLAADYIATMATELASVAWHAGESLLPFLLDMAAHEARTLAISERRGRIIPRTISGGVLPRPPQ